MPTIEVDYAEFERMLGISLNKNLEKIDDVLALAKGEVKLFDEKEGTMSIEIKDTNRPDIWNIEGLVRTLRGFLGIDTGLKQYTANRSLAEVYVDQRLKNIRPYIGCSIIKNAELSDATIRGLMQLQDKLDHTYGRNRRRTSIGLYDFDQITQPLHYTVTKPTDSSLVPLGFDKKMNLKEILERHPKGLEYGSIVKKHSVYPILLDSKKKVLSFPPIINSNDLGRVTEATENILIEVTGTNHDTVLNTLRIVTLSFIDRGGKAYSATIHYEPDDLTVVTPLFRTGLMELDIGYVNKILGLGLTAKQAVELLGKAGFGVEKSDRNKVIVQVPSYRTDIMHQVDLAEDIAIAYGYNNIEPLWRKLPAIGSTRPEQGLLDAARDLMTGLGFQEVLTYTMTNQENLFARMNLEKQSVVEIANPKVQTLTCLRNWLIPNLMDFLSNNLHVEYPQRIFELGKTTVPDERRETRTRDEETLAAAISHANASFSETKSFLDAFFTNIGMPWRIEEAKHPSFIEGRMGTVVVDRANIGIMGEITPRVLEAWKLENPTAAFELNMEKIVRIKQTSS